MKLLGRRLQLHTRVWPPCLPGPIRVADSMSPVLTSAVVGRQLLLSLAPLRSTLKSRPNTHPLFPQSTGSSLSLLRNCEPSAQT